MQMVNVALMQTSTSCLCTQSMMDVDAGDQGMSTEAAGALTNATAEVHTSAANMPDTSRHNGYSRKLPSPMQQNLNACIKHAASLLCGAACATRIL